MGTEPDPALFGFMRMPTPEQVDQSFEVEVLKPVMLMFNRAIKLAFRQQPGPTYQVPWDEVFIELRREDRIPPASAQSAFRDRVLDVLNRALGESGWRCEVVVDRSPRPEPRMLLISRVPTPNETIHLRPTHALPIDPAKLRPVAPPTPTKVCSIPDCGCHGSAHDR